MCVVGTFVRCRWRSRAWATCLVGWFPMSRRERGERLVRRLFRGVSWAGEGGSYRLLGRVIAGRRAGGGVCPSVARLPQLRRTDLARRDGLVRRVGTAMVVSALWHSCSV